MIFNVCIIIIVSYLFNYYINPDMTMITAAYKLQFIGILELEHKKPFEELNLLLFESVISEITPWNISLFKKQLLLFTKK